MKNPMKNSIDTIGNRTRDLPVCSSVPQPTAPPRAPLGEQYRSLSSSLCSFLHSPVTSSLLGPNILLNTLFSDILSLRSSLHVSDQVSHPYKTTGKIIVLYINEKCTSNSRTILLKIFVYHHRLWSRYSQHIFTK